MLNPEERIPYACRYCRDIRLVWGGHKEIPCPACSHLDPSEREERIRASAAERLPKPSITLLDLTPEEFEDYRGLLVTNPSAHKLTVLAWMEGRRYRPAEDPEFLEEVEARLEAWRRKTITWDGIEPEWVRLYRAGDPLPGYERETAELERRAERQNSGGSSGSSPHPDRPPTFLGQRQRTNAPTFTGRQ